MPATNKCGTLTKNWLRIIILLTVSVMGYLIMSSNFFWKDNSYNMKANTTTPYHLSVTESTIRVIKESSKAFKDLKGNLHNMKAIATKQYHLNATPSTMRVHGESSQAIVDGLQSSIKGVLKPTAYDYLAFIHTFKDADKTGDSNERNQAYADLFRTGFGLTPYTTEDNKKAWMENGVVYRPIREKLRLMSSHPNIPTHHPSDFEHYVPFNEKQFYPGGKAPSGEGTKPKIILWYNRIGYLPELNNLEPLRLCPDFPCQITSNQKYAEESSAMIFEGTGLSTSPPKRRPDQVFVFHYVETLPQPGDARFIKLAQLPWKNAFNWTMSYRMNSDIQSYYGIIRKRPEPLEKNFKTIIAGKSKMAATMISHCKTVGLREQYVKNLKKYIGVDVYGSCGPYNCPRGDDVQCGKIFESKYKFYLSFENAVCDEYITEKFFRYMSLDIVVVARGGGAYLKHAPRGTFINAADFASSKDLADYLNHLAKNPAEYEAILREKAKFVSLYEAWYHAANNRVTYAHHHYEAIPVCRICYWLWNLEAHHKTIPDIKTWLYNFTCRNAHSFL